MVMWFKYWIYIKKDSLFLAVKLTKNANLYKYFYSRIGIGFDSRSHFLIPSFDFDKNVIIFGINNSSSTHTDIRKKIF